MTAPRLTGCGTALVTPFNADGSLDEGALRALVDWQIDEGIHFLVPCGSTGEAATMTTRRAPARRRDRRRAGARVACRSSPARAATTRRRRSRCRRRCATPARRTCFTRRRCTTSRRSAASSRTIARSPRRWICRSSSTTFRVAREQHRGEDDARDVEDPGNRGGEGGVGPICRRSPTSSRGRRAEFSVLSGDDELTLPVMALGGDGIISVVSNATPKLMARALRRDEGGRLRRARGRSISGCCRGCAPRSSSRIRIPAKAALAMMGRIEERAAPAAGRR